MGACSLGRTAVTVVVVVGGGGGEAFEEDSSPEFVVILVAPERGSEVDSDRVVRCRRNDGPPSSPNKKGEEEWPDECAAEGGLLFDVCGLEFPSIPRYTKAAAMKRVRYINGLESRARLVVMRA